MIFPRLVVDMLTMVHPGGREVTELYGWEIRELERERPHEP